MVIRSSTKLVLAVLGITIGSTIAAQTDNDISSMESAVTKTNQTIGVISFTPSTLVVGGITVASATATSGLAVKFTSTTPAVCIATNTNGKTIVGIAGGSCIVMANQAGNASYNPAPSQTKTITVGKASQTIGLLTFTPTTLVVGRTTTVNATATSGLAVKFKSTTPSQCAVLGKVVTAIAVGTCTVAANQAGNTNYKAAPQVTQDITIGKGSQTIGAISFDPPTLAVGGTTTADATATSNLPVRFRSTTSAICTTGGINGSTVTGVAVGTCIVAASQAGNADYKAASQKTQSIDVGAAVSVVHGLNDTGITTCSNSYQDGLVCPVSNFPRQDAEVGRDATHNDDSDGHAGFSFTKLDASGNSLPASASDWSCVKDNVTGLIWEVKTNDGGLRDKDNSYSWYNPDSTTNGGAVGYQNYGSCTGGIHCDTYSFVQAVNAAGLCGHNDWRMPLVDELSGITDLSRYSPAIDTSFFPNTNASYFWSGSPVAGYSDYAWGVSFFLGDGYWLYRNDANAVRLVRGGQ
ncbi:exported hypothetical protein [Gammaproteobacteria bacterium]